MHVLLSVLLIEIIFVTWKLHLRQVCINRVDDTFVYRIAIY